MISHSLRASSGVAPLLSSLCTSSSRLNLAAIRSASSAVFTTTSVLVVTLIYLTTTYLLERMSLINNITLIASSQLFGVSSLRYFTAEFLLVFPYTTLLSESTAMSNSSDLNNNFIIFLCVNVLNNRTPVRLQP